jgi:hypothetical protein
MYGTYKVLTVQSVQDHDCSDEFIILKSERFVNIRLSSFIKLADISVEIFGILSPRGWVSQNSFRKIAQNTKELRTNY